MTEFRQAAAGPSRPRRKPVAENWDEDFDFDLNIGTSTRSKAASDAQVQRTSHDIKVAVAGSDQMVAHAARASERLRKGKSKDEEQEDWDEDWDSPAQADKGMTRQPIGDSGHSTRALGVDHSSSSGGIASRRTTQNPAPLNLQPISPPRTSSVPSVPVPLRSQVPQSHAFSRSSERNAPSAWTSIPAPSTSGYPQPQSAVYPSTAIPTDSTSSFGSAWSAHSGGTPTRSTTSVTSPSTNAKRVLRHMKSGDMMPPPPLPGSGSPAVSKGVGSSLIRRVSEKRKSVGKSISIDQEQAQLASPSGTTGGKPGFWRRLSSQNVPGTYSSIIELGGLAARDSSIGLAHEQNRPRKPKVAGIAPRPSDRPQSNVLTTHLLSHLYRLISVLLATPQTHRMPRSTPDLPASLSRDHIRARVSLLSCDDLAAIWQKRSRAEEDQARFRQRRQCRADGYPAEAALSRPTRFNRSIRPIRASLGYRVHRPSNRSRAAIIYLPRRHNRLMSALPFRASDQVCINRSHTRQRPRSSLLRHHLAMTPKRHPRNVGQYQLSRPDHPAGQVTPGPAFRLDCRNPPDPLEPACPVGVLSKRGLR